MKQRLVTDRQTERHQAVAYTVLCMCVAYESCGKMKAELCSTGSTDMAVTANYVLMIHDRRCEFWALDSA